MPIEIRELVIRAIVDPSAGSGKDGCGGDAGSATPAAAADGAALVQACVAEVMRQLRLAGEP